MESITTIQLGFLIVFIGFFFTAGVYILCCLYFAIDEIKESCNRIEEEVFKIRFDIAEEKFHPLSEQQKEEVRLYSELKSKMSNND